jgi:hypothetical protein
MKKILSIKAMIDCSIFLGEKIEIFRNKNSFYQKKCFILLFFIMENTGSF